MRHIKIFEQFFSSNKLNEAKEIPLPGGFINVHTDNSNENDGWVVKKDIVYFETNTTKRLDQSGRDMGTPNNLDIRSRSGETTTVLAFPSDAFVEQDKNINMLVTNYKDLKAGKQPIKNVLAKNPSEATTKAYEILAAATYLTKSPADPKVVGDMIRSFFEIRKLYPSYMTGNALLKGFMQGLLNGYNNPNFGEYGKSEDWTYNIKEGKYKEEIRKALIDQGVIKVSS